MYWESPQLYWSNYIFWKLQQYISYYDQMSYFNLIWIGSLKTKVYKDLIKTKEIQTRLQMYSFRSSR